jgi:competence protein ComEC
LTILPLNGGEAVLFSGRQSDGGWLMDCGNAASVQFVTRPFLAAQGVNRLRRLVLTHGDVRHVGGGLRLVEVFPVREVLVSPVRFRSPSYREFSARFAGMPGKLRHVRRGDQLGPWTVLHPADEKPFPQADDNALVLRGDFAGTRILLLSDLGKPGQNALMQSGADVRADIVVSGLPTQGEPLADDLLRAINPKVIVVTDAEYPATARAGPALRARLLRQRTRVIYTREAGAVTVELRGKEWRVSAMRGGTFRGGSP